MNCFACGKSNVEGISFCEFCGATLRVSPNLEGPAAVRSAPAQSAAPGAAQIGKSLFSAFSLGEKFAIVGTIAAIVGFFLPWFSTPDLGAIPELMGKLAGSEPIHISLTGLDLTKYLGSIYIVLLAAVAAGVLLFFFRRVGGPGKMLIAGFLVLIGSMYGPGNVAALLAVPLIQSLAGIGFWLLALGYCAIAAGGLISIGTFGKTAR